MALCSSVVGLRPSSAGEARSIACHEFLCPCFTVNVCRLLTTVCSQTTPLLLDILSDDRYSIVAGLGWLPESPFSTAWSVPASRLVLGPVWHFCGSQKLKMNEISAEAGEGPP